MSQVFLNPAGAKCTQWLPPGLRWGGRGVKIVGGWVGFGAPAERGGFSVARSVLVAAHGKDRNEMRLKNLRLKTPPLKNLRGGLISERAAVLVLAGATTLGTLVLVSTVTAQSPAGGSGGVVPQPTKVAVVSPNRVFAEMQETKDLKVRLQNEVTKLDEEGRQKRQKLDDLQRDRTMLKVNTPEFSDKTRDLVRGQVEFQAWAQVSQAELQRVQKEQTRILYDKIGAMTAQIAAQKGFDIVIADQRVEIPDNLEQVTPEQLRGLLSARNVAYAAPSVDLTSEVTVQLDVQYKNTPAGATPPVPAVGSTPATGTPPAAGK